MFTAHGELRELQLWLMSGAVKLPHIQVTADDEYGECWVQHVKNDDLHVRAIKDKPHSFSEQLENLMNASFSRNIYGGLPPCY